MNDQPENRLFQAVITQQFTDAVRPCSDTDSARAWLLGKSNDFRDVCDYAGWTPEYIYRKAQVLAAEGWPNNKRLMVA